LFPLGQSSLRPYFSAYKQFLHKHFPPTRETLLSPVPTLPSLLSFFPPQTSLFSPPNSLPLPNHTSLPI